MTLLNIYFQSPDRYLLIKSLRVIKLLTPHDAYIYNQIGAKQALNTSFFKNTATAQ